jgi:hypothetical protein
VPVERLDETLMIPIFDPDRFRVFARRMRLVIAAMADAFPLRLFPEESFLLGCSAVVCTCCDIDFSGSLSSLENTAPELSTRYLGRRLIYPLETSRS